MPHIDAYIFFDGTCAEAMRFYEKTLGGKLEGMHTYADVPAGEGQPGDPNRIMHASMLLDGRRLMASDTPPGQPHERMQGFSLSVHATDVDEGRRLFEALAEGGQVIMPWVPTFWAKGFGMLVDRFGTPWMANVGDA